MRLINVTPHVAQNDTNRTSAIDNRTTRHPGHEISQQRRKRVEEIFGWVKTVGAMRKPRHRGRELVDWFFTLTIAGYNLVRIANLEKVLASPCLVNSICEHEHVFQSVDRVPEFRKVSCRGNESQYEPVS